MKSSYDQEFYKALMSYFKKRSRCYTINSKERSLYLWICQIVHSNGLKISLNCNNIAIVRILGKIRCQFKTLFLCKTGKTTFFVDYLDKYVWTGQKLSPTSQLSYINISLRLPRILPQAKQAPSFLGCNKSIVSVILIYHTITPFVLIRNNYAVSLF